MISGLSLQDKDGNDVVLQSGSSPFKRNIVSVHGLEGLPSQRVVTRPRPTGHGGIDDTKWSEGSLIPIVGEIVSQVGIEDAWTEFHSVLAPMQDTLDYGPALLKWQEGLSTYTNLITNPRAADAALTGYAASGSATVSQETSLSSTAPGCPVNTSTAAKCVTIANVTGVLWSRAVTTGDLLAFSVWVYTSALTATGVRARILNAANATKGTSAVTITTTGSWTRLTVFAVADATETWKFFIEQTGAGGATFYATAWQIESNTVANTYTDGYQSNSEWTGAPDASTSVYNSPKQRLVKLASDVDPPIEQVAAILNYQAQFYSPDPRSYSQVLQTVSSLPLSTASGGLRFPIKFPFKFNASSGGTVLVRNGGNRKTPPIFRVYGMCQNPTIINTTTGEQIAVLGTIATGDYLEIGTDSVGQRYAKYNGTTPANNMIDTVNSQWMELGRGNTNLQMIAGTFDAFAALTVILRSAFA